MEILRKYKERINFFELPKSDEDGLKINDNITLKITRDSFSRSVYAIIKGCTIRVTSSSKMIGEKTDKTISYHLFTNYYGVENEDHFVLSEKLDLQRKILFWSRSLDSYKNKLITLESDFSTTGIERKIEDIQHELRYFEETASRLERLEFTEEE